MSHTGPAPTVPVAPEVVLMAIRYGLPRLTYAHAEALGLVAGHARLLAHHGWLDGVVRDMGEACTWAKCRHDVDHHRAHAAIKEAS